MKSKPLVLLVEDEKPLLEIAKVHLQEAGLEVITCETATEAINNLQKNLTLIVTDLNLGHESGHSLISAALQVYPNLPIVVYSGNVNTSNEILTILCEAETGTAGVRYVRKPDISTLMTTVLNLLSK
jgi:CheY-like chemotaxis protein